MTHNPREQALLNQIKHARVGDESAPTVREHRKYEQARQQEARKAAEDRSTEEVDADARPTGTYTISSPGYDEG